MSKIGKKFLAAVKSGSEYCVRYRYGERYQGEIEWLDWDKGVLCYVEKANPEGEPGINILDETGWGYAGREKDLETDGSHVFGRNVEGPNQHLLQVQFL
jgi:hypothetical protein